METLKIGDLCFFDSMVGLIPCRLIAGDRSPTGSLRLTLQVTSRRGGVYVRGDTIETSPNWAIPRKSVKIRNGVKKIVPYNVEIN